VNFSRGLRSNECFSIHFIDKLGTTTTHSTRVHNQEDKQWCSYVLIKIILHCVTVSLQLTRFSTWQSKCSIEVFGLTSPGDVLRADPVDVATTTHKWHRHLREPAVGLGSWSVGVGSSTTHSVFRNWFIDVTVKSNMSRVNNPYKQSINRVCKSLVV